MQPLCLVLRPCCGATLRHCAAPAFPLLCGFSSTLLAAPSRWSALVDVAFAQSRALNFSLEFFSCSLLLSCFASFCYSECFSPLLWPFYGSLLWLIKYNNNCGRFSTDDCNVISECYCQFYVYLFFKYLHFTLTPSSFDSFRSVFVG